MTLGTWKPGQVHARSPSMGHYPWHAAGSSGGSCSSGTLLADAEAKSLGRCVSRGGRVNPTSFSVSWCYSQATADGWRWRAALLVLVVGYVVGFFSVPLGSTRKKPQRRQGRSGLCARLRTS